MKKHLQNIFFCLIWVMGFSSCSQKEDAVAPLENCDTMATVQLVPSCGLLLVLENNQKLVPLNVNVSTGTSGASVYKINGFEVQVGQQVIVGFKPANVTIGATPCNQSGYYNHPWVNITCIVSIENRF